MQGRPSGTPGFMPSQPSSLPMKQARASLWVRIWRTVSAANVGYSGTDTWPAIQIARSLIIHQAQFFERMATLEPGSQPWDCRCAAMRRTWSPIWLQVKSCTAPLPRGCVRATRLGAVCSQW
ncbi:hypothetical protein Y695_04446 [Hydrogenophaga sp. T4]|nr:hypothetical protein Y695_04446 [Hydrogenophaga sp. T4]